MAPNDPHLLAFTAYVVPSHSVPGVDYVINRIKSEVIAHHFQDEIIKYIAVLSWSVTPLILGFGKSHEQFYR